MYMYIAQTEQHKTYLLQEVIILEIDVHANSRNSVHHFIALGCNTSCKKTLKATVGQESTLKWGSTLQRIEMNQNFGKAVHCSKHKCMLVNSISYV